MIEKKCKQISGLFGFFSLSDTFHFKSVFSDLIKKKEIPFNLLMQKQRAITTEVTKRCFHSVSLFK